METALSFTCDDVFGILVDTLVASPFFLQAVIQPVYAFETILGSKTHTECMLR